MLFEILTKNTSRISLKLDFSFASSLGKNRARKSCQFCMYGYEFSWWGRFVSHNDPILWKYAFILSCTFLHGRTCDQSINFHAFLCSLARLKCFGFFFFTVLFAYAYGWLFGWLDSFNGIFTLCLSFNRLNKFSCVVYVKWSQVCLFV